MYELEDILERLDELLEELENVNSTDDLHLALEIGYQFRDELEAISNE